MQVKTFEAVDMKQALELVRDDMGPEAVIVSSRSVKKESSLFGMLGRKVLEVTAAVGETQDQQPPALRDRVSTDMPVPRPGRRGVYHEIRAVKQAVDPVLDEVRALREQIGPRDESSTTSDDLRADVASIRMMLSSMIGAGQIGPDAEGATAQRLFDFLMSRGVDEALARSLVQRVVARVEPGALDDIERLKLNLAAEMRSDLLRAERGSAPSRVQLFTGPTGVGKTTTIAKLAARAMQTSPEGVLIITTDVHRVAAVEQMMRFGEILGVPVEVAISPEDLARMLAQNQDKDRILIDTPGRNHRDAASLRSLRKLVDAADEAEVMLVMAATTRAVDSAEILASYDEFPCSRLIMTKLDETRVYGELYNSVVRSGRPIACVTTGQAVPEHLESLDVAGVLRKVLHG